MPAQRILIIQGHPDATQRHLCHALAEAYADGALGAGHEVRTIDVSRLDFPLLRSAQEWEQGALPPALQPAQEDIRWAGHLVFIYPLWLGDVPAVLKGFLEQVARPGFAFKADAGGKNPFGRKGLGGRSARIIVTMGMPALVYRWYFGAHSLKSLRRNVLAFVGIAPVRDTVIGMVDGLGEAGVRRWCDRLRALGARAR